MHLRLWYWAALRVGVRDDYREPDDSKPWWSETAAQTQLQSMLAWMFSATCRPPEDERFKGCQDYSWRLDDDNVFTIDHSIGM